MGKKIMSILCIYLVLSFCSCGVIQPQKKKETTVTSQPPATRMPRKRNKPEPTEKPYEVIEKRNIGIAGRHYKYAAYIRTVKGEVRLMALKTDEDELYIPSEIEGDPVVNLGWQDLNVSEWSDQIKSKLEWNWGKKNKNLKRLVIAEGVQSVTRRCFAEISSDEVIIPKSMKEIEMSAFYEAEIKRVLVKSSQVNLGSSAFMGSTLEQIRLPDNFSGEIDSDCFNGSNLKEFRWPSYGKQKVEDMGSSVFEECKKLKKVTFPENQERIIIPKHSFFWCKKLTKLEFPASTKKVVYEATHYTDNYKYGVSTLIFKGKNTKLKGGDIRDVNLLTEVPDGLSLITVKKIIAPKDSKAIEFAKKAVKIADMNEWKPEDATCENGLDHPAVLEEDLVLMEYETL